MDYRRINSHMILLGMVIVVGLFAAIIVRMSMLENGADGGTANLIFVLILGASAVLYLIIISTLSNSVIPWIMKRLPAPKKKAGVANPDDLSEEYADEPDGEDSGEKETEPQIATVTPAPPNIDWKEQHELEFQERLSPFREYTHFAMGPYVSESELARLDEYVELFAREAPLPKETAPIRPERLKNPDLYHFGWNMQNYFKVGKREDVVPWLQTVFSALRDLEFSTIKGKLHDPQTKRHTIPNIDDDSGFLDHMNDLRGRKFPKRENSKNLLVKRGFDRTGNSIVGAEIKKAVKHLSGVEESFRPVFSMAQEMCANSIEHANKDTGKKNWLFAIYYETDRVIFTMTDIGSGILSTLRKKADQILVDTLRRKDVDVLDRAFEKKYQSATSDKNRNKGLPKIKKINDEQYVDNLMVITNNVLLNFNDEKRSEVLETKFHGTFYYWELTNNCIDRWKNRQLN